ncbi:MAG: hypothetical protein RL215_394 [Planctomycetota bacterium]
MLITASEEFDGFEKGSASDSGNSKEEGEASGITAFQPTDEPSSDRAPGAGNPRKNGNGLEESDQECGVHGERFERCRPGLQTACGEQDQGGNEEAEGSSKWAVEEVFEGIFEAEPNDGDWDGSDDELCEQTRLSDCLEQFVSVDNSNRKQGTEMEGHIHGHALNPFRQRGARKAFEEGLGDDEVSRGADGKEFGDSLNDTEQNGVKEHGFGPSEVRCRQQSKGIGCWIVGNRPAAC